jgi:hypothetical protein
MPRLGDRALKVRSRNAGPFWVTVDIFCCTLSILEQVRHELGARTDPDMHGAQGIT